jgi:ketosteroid isomerase-like protein
VSDRDIQVVRDQFEAVNRRDFARAMDLYRDDVVLIVPRIEGAQNPGTYEGKEAVGEWFGDWFRSFADDYRFDLQEFRDLGPGLVFLHAKHGGRGRLSGAEVHGENYYLYSVRAGRVARVGFFPSREDALEAASLPEWSEAQTD